MLLPVLGTSVLTTRRPLASRIALLEGLRPLKQLGGCVGRGPLLLVGSARAAITGTSPTFFSGISMTSAIVSGVKLWVVVPLSVVLLGSLIPGHFPLSFTNFVWVQRGVQAVAAMLVDAGGRHRGRCGRRTMNHRRLLHTEYSHHVHGRFSSSSPPFRALYGRIYLL